MPCPIHFQNMVEHRVREVLFDTRAGQPVLAHPFPSLRRFFLAEVWVGGLGSEGGCLLIQSLYISYIIVLWLVYIAHYSTVN